MFSTGSNSHTPATGYPHNSGTHWLSEGKWGSLGRRRKRNCCPRRGTLFERRGEVSRVSPKGEWYADRGRSLREQRGVTWGVRCVGPGWRRRKYAAYIRRRTVGNQHPVHFWTHLEYLESKNENPGTWVRRTQRRTKGENGRLSGLYPEKQAEGREGGGPGATGVE